jgi:C4-dicarboxylate transporter DctM subunit
MIRFATALVGHWHGGLALGGVLACALFAAVSGSSPATVVAIGSIVLPAMVAQGFPKKFGVGVIGTAGALGILIPPSIVMVIYAVSANASIGKLFIAGIIPGIMLAALLMFVAWFVAWKRGYPRMKKANWGERWASFRESFWGLLLIVVVIGGIYTGIFTPTEAAAMSAAYAFFVSVYVYKDLTIKQVKKVLIDSANLSAMILYIITNAVLFSYLLTSEQIPQDLAQWITDMGLTPWMFLLIVNILLLIAGNFMEPSSILLITVPVLFPVAMKLGIDPIHLGVVMTVNMEIGMITPPVGLNLYVASGISGLGLTETTKACAPWILVMIAFLALITYVPIISLWLPNLLMGN